MFFILDSFMTTLMSSSAIRRKRKQFESGNLALAKTLKESLLIRNLEEKRIGRVNINRLVFGVAQRNKEF